MTENPCRTLVKALMGRLDDQSVGVRIYAYGGVMPMFFQLVPKGATECLHCSISQSLLFELDELGPDVIQAWAKAKAGNLRREPVWSKENCERVAVGLPVL